MEKLSPIDILKYATEFYMEDCVTGIRKHVDFFEVDCVITDPPYCNERREEHRKVGTTTRLTRLGWFDYVSPDRFNDFFTELFDLCYKRMKKDAHFYLFCDEYTLPRFRQLIDKRFYYWNTLIWDKCNVGMGYHYRHQYEPIIFASKEKKTRKLNSLSISNILRVKRVPWKQQQHPTEKPLELIKILVQQSTKEGDLILDPFLGSGTTLQACRELGRNAVGFEINPNYREIIRKKAVCVEG